MEIFKSKMRYVTFATVGILYDLTGFFLVTFVYQNSTKDPNGFVLYHNQKLHHLLEPTKEDSIILKGAIYLILFGFAFSLTNELLNIKGKLSRTGTFFAQGILLLSLLFLIQCFIKVGDRVINALLKAIMA